ncbi:M48 family metallopeptidase [Pectinatus haikarae]|uniref:Metal-dependent hydrolase n=2 Tax=Pectinatus haikarae TaxID=349096 RepID=A0ABT9Y824_9FIRM|nr:SprT family zinc-dependent metalloprotease [Pectinatus haikarae]MDQ0203989.1 putative metal-dependent hydrolase [Pectinatus haikarae]
MPRIKLGDKLFTFKQERQKRKTITIALKAHGNILIKTPHNTTDEEVYKILYRYADWIKKKDQTYEELSLNAPINDKYITYKGAPLYIERIFASTPPLIKVSGEKVIVKYEGSIFLPLSDIFVPWYKEQARLHLSQRTAFWAEEMQVAVLHITIRDQKSRWGSCSARHNINYNWRIMMAPPAIIDYLVIHETAHLLQMNHSASFWQIVKKYDPSFEAHRLWLKQNGDSLLNVLRL